MTALALSNVLLWLTNIALIVTVLALARQIGVLNERLTPLGALTMDHGPKVGEAAPSFKLSTLCGGEIVVGRDGHDARQSLSCARLRCSQVLIVGTGRPKRLASASRLKPR